MCTVRLGMVYSKVVFSASDSRPDVPDATCSCILLPYPVTDNLGIMYEDYFTVVDSNWRVLTDTLTLDVPHCNLKLENDIFAEPV